MTTFRIPLQLLESIRKDLARSHPFAGERVGLLQTASIRLGNELLVLAKSYQPIVDSAYVIDHTVGARIGVDAVRSAVSLALAGRASGTGVFHVHMHDHSGVPRLSHTDANELPRFVQGLQNSNDQAVHGAIVVGTNQVLGLYLDAAKPVLSQFDVVSAVGSQMELTFGRRSPKPSEHLSRQGFLGPRSAEVFAGSRIAIIGLGGGGSHVFQQLAHLGFKRLCAADPDSVEESNLNRLVGGTLADAERATPKIDVARRVARSLGIDNDCVFLHGRWQDNAELIRACDIIVGCVDSFAARREIEVLARRYLIPYVDIGMDVHEAAHEGPRMAGQVIASIPGHPCMTCLGFLTRERLAIEAAHYGAAGGRPQVIWANGVLASTAVGTVVAILSGWAKRELPIYLSYDGNSGELVPHPRLQYLGTKDCDHYPLSAVGDPTFDRV